MTYQDPSRDANEKYASNRRFDRVDLRGH
eukprot:COSAG02_NODE_71807_length_189_cov_55.422222_1_plen_28_part_10